MKLCMGCMNQMDDHLKICPHCGFDESSLKQESFFLDPGTIIGGKYIVGKVLKYGGHTVSYLGMDAEVNRKVVVKEYLPSDFSTRSEGETEITIYSGEAQIQFERGLTNFLNEANKIESLDKPEGIAKVYDCVAENDTGYVISEYLEGKTLKEILDSGKRYNVKEATAFICKILKGLSKVHPMNIIHCDISPETIMVTDSGEIKLLDFGATRYVTTANSKSLAIILKQGYAPEEQYRSSGKRGPWTDVYALGAVMYRMITGIVPQESVERALVDELKDPSKMGVSIPPNIENALMNALNVYAEDRTKNADAFLRELTTPGTKRVKVINKNNETGKFPTWAKVLVASLLLIVVAGGVFLVRKPLKKEENKGAEEKTYTIPDLSGQIYKENLLEGITLIPKYVYDPDNDGKIISQSLSPKILTSGEYGDVEVNENRASGTMTVRVASKDYVAYSDIKDKWKMHADQMKEGLGLKDAQMDAREEKGPYNTVKEIEIKGKDTLTADKINVDTEDDYIKISDIKTVSYYAKDFFYWDPFGDYKGKYIDKIKMQPVYKLDSGERTEDGEGDITEDPAIVDSGWYSFDYNAGYIFKQNVDADTKVDCSGELDKEIQPLLCVVGDEKYITHQGTGKDLKENLESFGFKDITIEGSKEEDPIVNIEISYKAEKAEKAEEEVFYSDDNGKKFFKKDNGISFVITTKERTTQAPKPGPSVPGSDDYNF